MLKLLDRDISAGYELFALGIANEKDLEGLVEAIQVSVTLKRIVVVNPELLDLTPLRGRGLDRLILWRAAWPDVLALLEQLTRIGGSSGEVLVAYGHRVIRERQRSLLPSLTASIRATQSQGVSI